MSFAIVGSIADVAGLIGVSADVLTTSAVVDSTVAAIGAAAGDAAASTVSSLVPELTDSGEITDSAINAANELGSDASSATNSTPLNADQGSQLTSDPNELGSNVSTPANTTPATQQQIQNIVNGQTNLNPSNTVNGTIGNWTSGYLNLSDNPGDTIEGLQSQLNNPDNGGDGGLLKSAMANPFTPLAASALGGAGTEMAKLKQQQLQYQQLLDQQSRHNAAVTAAAPGGLLASSGNPLLRPAGPTLPTYGNG
jgi:hypothetical protein